MGLDDGLNSQVHGCRVEEYSLVGIDDLRFQKKKKVCVTSADSWKFIPRLEHPRVGYTF